MILSFYKVHWIHLPGAEIWEAKLPVNIVKSVLALGPKVHRGSFGTNNIIVALFFFFFLFLLDLFGHS